LEDLIGKMKEEPEYKNLKQHLDESDPNYVPYKDFQPDLLKKDKNARPTLAQTLMENAKDQIEAQELGDVLEEVKAKYGSHRDEMLIKYLFEKKNERLNNGLKLMKLLDYTMKR